MWLGPGGGEARSYIYDLCHAEWWREEMRSYIITIPPLWGRGEGGGASKVIYDLLPCGIS